MFFLPTYATPVSWPIFLWSNNVDCFIFSNSCLLDLLMTCLFTHFVNCISLQKSVYIKFLKISLQLSEYDILKHCPGRMESILLIFLTSFYCSPEGTMLNITSIVSTKIVSLFQEMLEVREEHE